MYLARTWRLQWRTAFMRFCPNEKGQWIWAWGKRAFEGFISYCMFYWCPLGLLFYPAPAPVWTVHPHAVSFLQHCPSLALVKLGSWVLNLFPGPSIFYLLHPRSLSRFLQETGSHRGCLSWFLWVYVGQALGEEDHVTEPVTACPCLLFTLAP